MLAYKMVTKLMIFGLCVSYSICVKSMGDDLERQLVNPVGQQPRSSYVSWGISLPQSIRQCLFGSQSTAITLPAPTAPSRLATLCTQSSIKRMLILGSAIALATTVTYYTVGAYNDVVRGLEDTEAAARDAFEECRGRELRCEAAFDMLIQVCNNTLHKQ
jgi:hypothetical protein